MFHLLFCRMSQLAQIGGISLEEALLLHLCFEGFAYGLIVVFKECSSEVLDL